MVRIVADTSALVSLGTVSDATTNPLDILLESHELLLPKQVLEELAETASYDDTSGEAAQAVLDRKNAFETRLVELDETFPLDDGENAAVTLANEVDAVQLLCDEFNRLALIHASLVDAVQLLCDEFNRLALIHASLVDTRLVTTPILLTALVRNDVLSPDSAQRFLERMSEARSWSANSYVARARATLQQQREGY